jgi:hypothetical protein
VAAGSLDGKPNIAPQDNIFWSEKADWYKVGINSKRYPKFPE